MADDGRARDGAGEGGEAAMHSRASGGLRCDVKPGAVLLVLALVGGCLGSPGASPVAVIEPMPDQPRAVVVGFSGELVATPLQPARIEHAFEVAASVVEVRVDLNWTQAADDATLTLVDPRGKEQGTGAMDGGTSRSVATTKPPAAGTWKVVVSSQRALKDAYRVTVTLSDPIPGVKTLQEALALGAGSFAEVNFVMEGDESITYEWTLRDPAGSATFNVHSHENGEVKVHAESAGAKGRATFTSPHRGIYSLLWESKGPATAAEFRMVGAFRLHSQTPLAS